MGLLDNLSEEALREVLLRFSVPEKWRSSLLSVKQEIPQILDEISQELKPGRIYTLLHPLSLEVILFLMAKASQEKSKKQISLYLSRLREEHVFMTGNDLVQMGIPKGPAYAQILNELLEARLNGEVSSREDEQ